MPSRECAHCGRRFQRHEGRIWVDDKPIELCHPDEGLDCYHLVTVYHEDIGSRRA